jgi:hypothetical protein
MSPDLIEAALRPHVDSDELAGVVAVSARGTDPDAFWTAVAAWP